MFIGEVGKFVFFRRQVSEREVYQKKTINIGSFFTELFKNKKGAVFLKRSFI